MSLVTGSITARYAERRTQELLNEFLKGYFNGQPHQSPNGDVTFSLCDLLFNQTDLPTPQVDSTTGAVKPQLHTIFTDWRVEEQWWVSGNIGTWATIVAQPASGVSYGATTESTISETVHGKLIRSLPNASQIRWFDPGSGFVEQTSQDGMTWTTTRTFDAGVTALRWIRSGNDGISGDYLEQVNIGGNWSTIRTIIPDNPIWDGTKKRASVTGELSFFVRVTYPGNDAQKSDFLTRTIAANLDELLRDELARVPLMQKGFDQLMHRSGPRALPTTGYAARLLVYGFKARYWLPKEAQ